MRIIGRTWIEPCSHVRPIMQPSVFTGYYETYSSKYRTYQRNIDNEIWSVRTIDVFHTLYYATVRFNYITTSCLGTDVVEMTTAVSYLVTIVIWPLFSILSHNPANWQPRIVINEYNEKFSYMDYVWKRCSSGTDGHLRYLYFKSNCIGLYEMHFSHSTSFLNPKTKNRVMFHRAIV